MRLATVVAAGLVSLAGSLVAPAVTATAGPAAQGAPRPGYWLVGGDGGVFAFHAPFEGSGAPVPGVPGICPYAFGPTIDVSAASVAHSGQVLSDRNCVGITGSEHGSGYWVANFSSMPSAFGSAAPTERLGCSSLNGASFGWSGIAATPTGRGFLLVSVNGGVLSCGDAVALGGVTDLDLAGAIAGIAATPDGRGYWLVGSDGGVFAFGDAGFHGSMGGAALDAPVVGIAATPDGRGYWLVGADGGVFAFGDARYAGSMGAHRLNEMITGMAADPDGTGYWLVAADGGVFAFGGAPFEGSLGGARLDAPIAGIAATP